MTLSWTFSIYSLRRRNDAAEINSQVHVRTSMPLFVAIKILNSLYGKILWKLFDYVVVSIEKIITAPATHKNLSACQRSCTDEHGCPSLCIDLVWFLTTVRFVPRKDVSSEILVRLVTSQIFLFITVFTQTGMVQTFSLFLSLEYSVLF